MNNWVLNQISARDSAIALTAIQNITSETLMLHY